jgi:holin-like protein
MTGEIVTRSLHIPIPGSIIGLVLLFILLAAGIIRLDWIEEVSNFLLDNMGILFVPFGVSLMAMTDILGSNLTAIAVIVPAGL